ncbi:hypothetical protein E8E14_002277 [Neopestalotiopsis sp. 37M]|nr:hypothetical protein E8E14_002277 [Neopestalotiopsis sp. 37M]
MTDDKPQSPIAPGDHTAYMQYAITRARLSPPGPDKFCVGAVLVDADKNEILSTGFSLEYLRDRPGDPGTTHAEQCCLIKLAERHNLPDERVAEVLPANAVLYTTMEPCNERLSGNRTCVDRIVALKSKIKAVYVGISEPDTFIRDNSGKRVLESAGVHFVKIDDGLQRELIEVTDWEESWETLFTKSLKLALDLELQAKGPSTEFDTLLPVLFETVVARLLRPLESDSRKVKPSLIHGDLWYANSGIDVSTGDCLLFDGCCFYAHNEYEFGQWMPACNRFGAEYLAAYHSHVPISQPEEDYQGRLDLYKLRFNTHVSALFMDNPDLRDQMLGDIRDLVSRYGQ